MFALEKFHQYLYERHFKLVTDHKPLVAISGENRAVPILAANRLAQWAFMLGQYDYTVEYRKTADHGTADALSRFFCQARIAVSMGRKRRRTRQWCVQ